MLKKPQPNVVSFKVPVTEHPFALHPCTEHVLQLVTGCTQSFLLVNVNVAVDAPNSSKVLQVFYQAA
jgi:hypothetical protein